MASQTTKLSLTHRDRSSSRATRRLRREGRVPGVLYGGGEDAIAFDVDERDLRHALAASGAVVELTLDGATTPAVLKDTQRDPVRNDTKHVDFLRVRLDVAIQAEVHIELLGADDSPGVKEGGILDQVTREVTIEALPNEIPEVIQHDVSGMAMNETLTLDAITAPRGVTILGDLHEITIATLNPPSVSTEDEDAELEQETERVGETPAAAGSDDASADAGDAAGE